MLNICQV